MSAGRFSLNSISVQSDADSPERLQRIMTFSHEQMSWWKGEKGIQKSRLLIGKIDENLRFLGFFLTQSHLLNCLPSRPAARFLQALQSSAVAPVLLELARIPLERSESQSQPSKHHLGGLVRGPKGSFVQKLWNNG